MKNVTLWQLLSFFSATDVKNVAEQLSHPSISNRKDLLLAFDICAKAALKEAPIADKTLHQRIYPDKPFKASRLRLLHSDLVQVIVQCMGYHWFDQQLLKRSFFEIEALQQMQAKDLMHRKIKQFAKQIEDIPTTPDQYFDFQYQLAELRYKSMSSQARTGETPLQEMEQWLDKTFAIKKLRHACMAIAHQRMNQSLFEHRWMQAIVNTIEEEGWALLPQVGIYYHCYQFLRLTQGEPHFSAFRQMIDQPSFLFPEEELRTLYLLAINFGIQKVNAMEEPYFKETLQLYQQALDKKILLENGQLSPFAFSNMVAIADRMGELAWALSFIDTYAYLLPAKTRTPILSLNKARLAYSMRQLDEAMSLLQSADYKDPIHAMSAKIMLMKIYYENGDFDVLESHIDNMKNFIQRKSNLGYHILNYKNIIKFAKRLLALPMRNTKKKEAFIQAVQAQETLTERAWFLKMTN